MSLDVYLEGPERTVRCECSRCGHNHDSVERERIYKSNITHNLGQMARVAGIYQTLWRPEELGKTKASQLIEPLSAGLAMLRAEPARFRALDDPGGWGLYVNFVPFVSAYLDACRSHPDASVRVCR